MSWLTDWQYRKAITIDSSLIDADLTDFPVLVKLTSSNFDFSKAQSNGNDIQFTSDDGETLLKYERECHDSTSSLAEYWVKIPSVLSASDTTFYIYYNKPDAADGADPTNVWDANFKGVWHLNQDPSGTAPQELDSTANSNNGTSNGSMTSDDLVEGQIAKALDFDGSNDYIDCGNDASLNITDAVTFEVWINPASSQASYPSRIFNIQDSKPRNFEASLESNNSINATNWNGTVGAVNYTTTDAVSSGINTLITVIFQDNNDKVYFNDAEKASSSDSPVPPVDGTLDIGRHPSQGKYFKGIIDELRISDIARSPAWIKASYNSGNDSLNTFGAEEFSGVINFLDGKIIIKGARVDLLDGKARVRNSLVNLLDGKADINYSIINSLDGKVDVKDTTSSFFDGKANVGDNTVKIIDGKLGIRDKAVNLLDGKTHITKVASPNLLDGKALIKDSAINLFNSKVAVNNPTILLDGKTRVRGPALNFLDSKTDIEDSDINSLDSKIRVKDCGIKYLDGKAHVVNHIADFLDGKVDIKDSVLDIFDVKARIKDSTVNLFDSRIDVNTPTLLLDGKTRVKDSAIELIDGKVRIKDSKINPLDGRTHVVYHTTNLLDSMIDIKDSTIAFLDGKTRIKDTTFVVFDGKTHIVYHVINPLDGKVKVILSTVNALDGKTRIKDSTTNLFDGKTDVNTPTILLDGKTRIKSAIAKLFDGKAIVKGSVANLFDGWTKVYYHAINLLDSKAKVFCTKIGYLDGKTNIKDTLTKALEGKIDINYSAINLLDGFVDIIYQIGSPFDGKISLKDSYIKFLDGDVDVVSHGINLFDGKTSIGCFVTNSLDGKTKIESSVINSLDGFINISGSAITLLDGKTVITIPSPVNLLDGRANIVSIITNLFNSKVDVKDSLVNFADGRLDIEDSTILLLDGKAVISRLTDNTSLFNGGARIKDSVSGLLDGKVLVTGIVLTSNPLDGKTYITKVAEKLRSLGLSICLNNFAVSQYCRYDFDSMYGRMAAGKDGIFVLNNADNDNGKYIESVIELPLTDLGISNLKRLRNVYVGYETNGSLKLKVQDDEGNEREYILNNNGNLQQGGRIPIGRDGKGRYWQLRLENIDGCDFSLDTIEVIPVILRRKF